MVGLGWLFVLVTIRERINSANWVDGEANKHIQTHSDTHRLAAPLSSEMPRRQKGHKRRHCPCFLSAVAVFIPPLHDGRLLFHFPNSCLSASGLLDFSWPLFPLPFSLPILQFGFITCHICLACFETNPHFVLVVIGVCFCTFLEESFYSFYMRKNCIGSDNV